MSIIRQFTELESDLQKKDSMVLQAAYAVDQVARTLSETHQTLSQLPTARLLALLNHDVADTLATLAANNAIGAAVNTSLDELDYPLFATRAPVEVGFPNITFDGTSFVATPAQPQDDANS
jgi:hypothetical protein